MRDLIHRITAADLRLFRRIAGWRSSRLARLRRAPASGAERLMAALSASADLSRIWLVISTALFGFGGRRGKRAAARGVGSIAATSAIVNLVLKPLVHRSRPVRDRIPAARQLVRQPQTTSFPSGHAASAAAFAAGVALERPAAGIAIAPLAAGVAYSRVFNGVHYPIDVVVGWALGGIVALAGARLWPHAAEMKNEAAATGRRQRLAPNPSGEGVVVIVNPESGSASDLRRATARQIEALLPAAEVIELSGSDDPSRLAREAAARADVLGVCGGDGTLAAAAQAAVESDRPLLVFPGGTMNHLAQDLGVTGAEDAVGAIARGEAARIDVATVDGLVFVNNASLGAHVELVEARRRLQRRIGRWPAQLLAAARAVFATDPVEVVLDGRRTAVWLGFIGNGAYHGRGIAPGWRRSLAAGGLDVRLLEATRHRSRLRALVALLLAGAGRRGALSMSREQRVRLQPAGAALALTRDGETLAVEDLTTISSHPGGLLVYAPEINGFG